jgi:hypothetical protein
MNVGESTSNAKTIIFRMMMREDNKNVHLMSVLNLNSREEFCTPNSKAFHSKMIEILSFINNLIGIPINGEWAKCANFLTIKKNLGKTLVNARDRKGRIA